MVQLGRYALIALLTIGYYGLLYYAAISRAYPWLSLLLALVPVVGVALFAVWHSHLRYWLAGGIIALLAAVVVLLGDKIVAHFQWFYLAQHAGMNFALALLFGLTLRAGHTPLITRFADIVHDELTPSQLSYTRKLTLVWTLFFVGTALCSLVLFLFTTIELWSFFANVLYLPLLLAMFAGEYMVRLRVLTDVKHVGLIESFRTSSRYFREKHAKRSND